MATLRKGTVFVQSYPGCSNPIFTIKEGEIRSKIYWCKVINKSCNFYNCPKNNNKGVND
jgi:hypothetical protein